MSVSFWRECRPVAHILIAIWATASPSSKWKNYLDWQWWAVELGCIVRNRHALQRLRCTYRATAGKPRWNMWLLKNFVSSLSSVEMYLVSLKWPEGSTLIRWTRSNKSHGLWLFTQDFIISPPLNAHFITFYTWLRRLYEGRESLHTGTRLSAYTGKVNWMFTKSRQPFWTSPISSH